MKHWFLLSLILFCFSGFSQQIELNGQYNGENLYVLSSVTNDGDFCVTGLSINGNKTANEFNSSSFEMDLSQLNLKLGDSVKIVMNHKEACIPKVINPEAIMFKNNFTFTSLIISRSGMLSWAIEGDAGDEGFEIQQYRWNKWTVAGVVKMADSTSYNRFSFETLSHYGQNLYRVCQTDKHGNISCSAEKKYRTVVKEIFILSQKVGDELEFTYETLYEIYTEDGQLLLKGIDSDVDVSELPKGSYWVNYDNKTERFVKK